ncbi:hypothetical protein HanIR_Chr11g0550951 [Helianthus annuus]|nr:hypothetical protein HanIR_Chr11g0550951 [Helianthus annuus]
MREIVGHHFEHCRQERKRLTDPFRFFLISTDLVNIPRFIISFLVMLIDCQSLTSCFLKYPTQHPL